MGLLRKCKTRITAKFHKTGLVICSHSKEGKTLSYSRINLVVYAFSEILLYTHFISTLFEAILMRVYHVLGEKKLFPNYSQNRTKEF